MDHGDLEFQEVYYHAEVQRDTGVQRMEELGWKVHSSAFLPYKKLEVMVRSLLPGLNQGVTKQGKVGCIQVVFSTDGSVEESRPPGILQRVEEWFIRIPRWLSYGVLSAAVALIMIWFSFTFENEFWRVIGVTGILAPVMWLEVTVFGFESSGYSILSRYMLIAVALFWFLIGAAIGKILSFPLFQKLSETRKLSIAVAIELAVIIIGFLSIFIKTGG